MKLHTRTRVSILIEAPFLRRLTDLWDAEGVEGYTVLPALSGKGMQGRWNREGMVTDVNRQVLAFAIMDPQLVEPVLERVREELSGSVTLVTVEEVQLAT